MSSRTRISAALQCLARVPPGLPKTESVRCHSRESPNGCRSTDAANQLSNVWRQRLRSAFERIDWPPDPLRARAAALPLLLPERPLPDVRPEPPFRCEPEEAWLRELRLPAPPAEDFDLALDRPEFPAALLLLLPLLPVELRGLDPRLELPVMLRLLLPLLVEELLEFEPPLEERDLDCEENCRLPDDPAPEDRVPEL